MKAALSLIAAALILSSAAFALDLPPPPPDLPAITTAESLPPPPPVPPAPSLSLPTAAPSEGIPSYIIISLLAVVAVGLLVDFRENRKKWLG